MHVSNSVRCCECATQMPCANQGGTPTCTCRTSCNLVVFFSSFKCHIGKSNMLLWLASLFISYKILLKSKEFTMISTLPWFWTHFSSKDMSRANWINVHSGWPPPRKCHSNGMETKMPKLDISYHLLSTFFLFRRKWLLTSGLHLTGSSTSGQDFKRRCFQGHSPPSSMRDPCSNL